MKHLTRGSKWAAITLLAIVGATSVAATANAQEWRRDGWDHRDGEFRDGDRGRDWHGRDWHGREWRHGPPCRVVRVREYTRWGDWHWVSRRVCR